MATIQIKPTINAVNVHDKGTGRPQWYGAESNKAKWYTDGVPATGNTNGFYNIDGGTHYYAQYGQNTDGWAGVMFLDCVISITSQTENADGSIHVVGQLSLPSVDGFRTDHFTKGVSVVLDCHVNNVSTIHRTGLTGDTFNQLHNPDHVTFDVVVPPQGTSHAPNIRFNWTYPNHEYQDSQMTFGFDLFNPNPDTYKPDTIFTSSGGWEIINNQGTMENTYYDGSNWVTIPHLHRDKQNQVNAGSGHNYHDGTNWLQSPLPK